MGAKVTPPQPVLFACAGDSAAGVLSELRALAREEGVHVQGPFGAIVLRRDGGGETVVHSESLEELCFSGLPPQPETPERSSGGDAQTEARVRAEITRVLRRLRTPRPSLHRGASPRTPLVGYILIDLEDFEPGGERAGMETELFRVADLSLLASWIRESAPEIDLTLVAMTGRTAETGHDPTEPWFRAFSALIAELQEDAPVQRLYLVDGRDQYGGWVADSSELRRNAAEFLLHHGLSPYRDQLRSREERRITLDEDFLSVCGTFSTRSLDFEPESLERQVAKYLADTELEPLRHETIGARDEARLAKDAERTADAITDTHMKSLPIEEEEGEIRGVLERALKDVARQRPIARLVSYFEKLRPLLLRIVVSGELDERLESRYRAAAVLERQEKETYSRFEAWARLPYGVVYERGDRYSPRLAATPQFEVSVPSDPTYFRAGAAVLAAGLLGVVAAAAGWGTIFAVLGGLLGIIASALMDLPIGWETYEPVTIQEGEDAGEVEDLGYRKKPSSPALWAGSSLVALGVYSTLWALGPLIRVDVVPPAYAPFYYGGALIFLALGFALSWVHREEILCRLPELDDMDSGPSWSWRIPALACLAVGWVALASQLDGAVRLDGFEGWGYLICGLVALLAGVLVLRWRRAGDARLVIELPLKPRPLETGYRELSEGSVAVEPTRSPLDKLIPWIDELLVERDGGEDPRTWPAPRPKESVLDVLVVSYRERLASLYLESLKKERGVGLADLARRPEGWNDCLLAELDHPLPSAGDPLFLFAKHHFGRWLRERLALNGWVPLLEELRPEAGRLHAFIHRGLPLPWPPTRRDPRTDVSIITVGKELWDVIAPLANSESRDRLVPIQWQSPRALRAVRIVQGLTGGWLGYDELPRKRTSDARNVRSRV